MKYGVFALLFIFLACSLASAEMTFTHDLNYTTIWIKSGQSASIHTQCSEPGQSSFVFNWTVDGVQESTGQDFTFYGNQHSVSVHNVSASCSSPQSSKVINFTLEVLNADDWVLVIMPDTQYYSRGYPEIFTGQTKWSAELQQKLGIVFLLHEGDVVQDGYSESQWINSNNSMSLLDKANINYQVASGNHDYMLISNIKNRDLQLYNKYFPLSRFQIMSTFGGSYEGTAENTYHLFEVSGQKYLALTYEFCPRNSTLDWANSIASQYPDRKIIVNTHMYMNYNDLRTNKTSDYTCFAYNLAGDNNGEDQWNKFVSKHRNIVLVTSGHILGDGAAYRNDIGRNGAVVHQILANYQSETGNPNGGNGWLRLYVFRPSQNIIESQAYSPHLDRRSYNISESFKMSHDFRGFTAPIQGAASPMIDSLLDADPICFGC